MLPIIRLCKVAGNAGNEKCGGTTAEGLSSGIS